MRIARFVIFALIIFTGDHLIGKLLHHFYFNQMSGPHQSLTYTLADIKTEIVILGNSRAQHHYNSKILEDTLKLTCFNAGLDGGQSIILHDALLKVILKRYIPKMVILEFDPISIEYRSADYDKLSILLPYVQDFPILRPFILLKGKFENLKLLSSIYPFNSYVIDIIRFNTQTHAARKRDIKGYVPILDKEINTIQSRMSPLEASSKGDINICIDENKLNALIEIIDLCNQNGIQLFIINSPVFHLQNNISYCKTEFEKKVLNIFQKETVEFHDFTLDPNFTGRMDLFADIVHLNDRGAEIYTSLIAEMLKSKYKSIDKSLINNAIRK